jgi:phosphoenolpyruvate-protein kinase (PTS system EI component)
MKQQHIDMTGMPYFPGFAVGELQHGSQGDIAQRIVLLTQADVPALHIAPAGVIVIEAAPFSHTMITLLGLGAPTVLISAQQANQLQEAMTLCIDGVSGRITDVIDDTRTTTAAAAVDSVTPTGIVQAIHLYASVRQPMAAKQAVQLGAGAIGLVRTEFLLPADGRQPDVAFYLQTFRAICEAAAPLPVTFRLLDVAADKIPTWFPHRQAVGRPLGAQGVRLYQLDPVNTVIDAQLTALAALAQDFSLSVLIPFLVRVEEYTYWLDVIRQRLPGHVPVGAMAETPATVLDIASLLASADFVAIGCNDLMQILYAADRDLGELRHYLDPYAPLLFRLFRQIAQQAGEHLSQIQLCGVLTQTQGILPVLLGLGYRIFSVDAPFIPYLARLAAQYSFSECEALATKVCDATTTQEVLTLLQLPTNRHAPFSGS